MEEIICTDIKPIFKKEDILARLHCDEDDEIFERAEALKDDAARVLRPAYAVRRFDIDSVTKDGVYISGNFFQSRIVADKLKDEKTIYVYIATCGRKIMELIDAAEDELDKYILDQYSYIAYLQAMERLTLDAEERLGIKRQIRLCPGSVIDWSIGDVRKIFVLMDGAYQQLDVNVLDSGLINPLKSTSGMFFSSEAEFDSCAICPRVNCENRKAPFDEDLHNQMVNL